MDNISHKFDSDEKLNMMQDQLKNVMLMLPLMIEYTKYEVAITRAKYLALLDSGFTEAQAIELCKVPK